MELTRKQEEGLKLAIQRYKDKESYTCIGGFAGTGKSTLVEYIIKELGLNPIKDVVYCAYTGKASLVLKNKGCPNAMTLHRLLYVSIQQNDGTYIHLPLPELEYDYKVIVVDEVSMVPKDIWELLLSHKRYVIALGDPGQLPPIGESCHILDKPHIFLDEIMRQALDSPIIRLSMDIRNGKPLEIYNSNELVIVDKNHMDSEMFENVDQILVGKNATRQKINTYMRNKIFGIKNNIPVEGDKVICIKNYWKKVSAVGDVLVNGQIGIINGLRERNTKLLHPQLIANFLPEQYTLEQALTSKPKVYFKDINIDYKLLTDGTPTVNPSNKASFRRETEPLLFEYAYAITVHKSQGSEWDTVLVLEEHLPENHIKWLYTAVTRASKKLILVKDCDK